MGSIAASFVDRLGAPTLLLFLGLGMLLGEDGPGGIKFDDATLARDAGTLALMIILLEGGLLADRAEVRRALGPAGLLATIGVLATAGLVALAGVTGGCGAAATGGDAPGTEPAPVPGVGSIRAGSVAQLAQCRDGASLRSSRRRAASTTRLRRCS